MRGYRRFLLGATALLPMVFHAATANDFTSGLVGGIVGGMIGSIQQQQQQQILQQQQQQYQQQQQQQLLQQQQIEGDRQRAAAGAAAEARQRQQDAVARQQADARQRQQAEATARKQQQATADASAKAAEKAAADAATKQAAEERQRSEAANKLRADPVFTTILGPDDQDITVLVVGQDTPDIVRNLKGEPVFQKGATACLPFGTISADQNTIGWRFLVEVERKIERNGELVNSSLMLTACEPAAFADYDLIIFSRAQLSNATIEALTPLADALRKRQFVALATYKIAEFRASETARADSAHAEAARQEAERIDALKSFQTREPSVVSVIHTEAPASVVCIASSPDPDGVRYLLKRADAPFAGTISPDSAIRVIPSTDAIFIALKRKECTAAAAPAGALRDVMAGLMRDGFKVEVDKGVITTDQLAAWKVMSAQELATAQEQQARDLEARRKLEAQRAAQDEEARRLTEQRQRNDEIARSEELERMRKQVSSKANAVMDDFTKRLQRHITSVVNEVTETQQRARTGRVLTLQERSELQTKYAADRMDFEPWATQLVPLVKEGWEFGNLKPMVNDYGRAQWKQRTIEAITVRVEIPIVNRVIGDKRVICEDFTWINDEEFQFMRQPQAVSCADYERTYAEWSQANSFVSQWKLLPVQY